MGDGPDESPDTGSKSHMAIDTMRGTELDSSSNPSSAGSGLELENNWTVDADGVAAKGKSPGPLVYSASRQTGSGTQGLCEYCKLVELDAINLAELWKCEWNLGSLARILASNCPLCRLATRALHQIYRLDTSITFMDSLGDEFKLFWNNWNWENQCGGFQLVSPLPDLQTVWLCLGGNLKNAEALSRSMPPFFVSEVSPSVDISMISEWIRDCDQNHAACRWGSTHDFDSIFPGLEILRLIDVEEMCIVEMQAIPDYVCLSYVWGSASTTRLTSSNRPALMTKGGLAKVWGTLPRTITDAIQLCKKLSTRYLWIDALCLVQNDEKDVGSGVGVMDCIYEHSYFTIIAAEGHDANAGLPGISVCSRSREELMEILPGVSLGLYTELDALLSASYYDKRGWTLQERLLARRTLSFVDGRLYFRCREGDQVETTYYASQRFLLPRLGEYDFEDSPRLWRTKSMSHSNFVQLLKEYTGKQLTNELDAARAFMGILRRFSDSTGLSFFQGMPLARFHSYLLFMNHSHYTSLRRRSQFPSYSWCGWKGKIYVSSSASDMETWVQFYEKRGHRGPVRLETGGAEPVEKVNLGDLFRSSEHRERFRDLATVPSGEAGTAGAKSLPYPLLQFCTLSVFFKIPDISMTGTSARVVGIDGGEVLGLVMIDGLEEVDNSYQEGTVYEFIALCTSSCGGTAGLLMLDWEGSIAVRRGVAIIWSNSGSVLQKGFPPGPIWKEILLG